MPSTSFHSTALSPYVSSEDRYLLGEGTRGMLLLHTSGHSAVTGSGMPWMLGLLSWKRSKILSSSSRRSNWASRPYCIPHESTFSFCWRWTTENSSKTHIGWLIRQPSLKGGRKLGVSPYFLGWVCISPQSVTGLVVGWRKSKTELGEWARSFSPLPPSWVSQPPAYNHIPWCLWLAP